VRGLREIDVKSLTKVIAGTVGLAAFSVAVIAGLAAGNAATDVLLRAVVAMAVCHAIGLMLGAMGERTVDEYVKSYYASRLSHPGSTGESSVDNSTRTVEKSGIAKSAG